MLGVVWCGVVVFVLHMIVHYTFHLWYTHHHGFSYTQAAQIIQAAVRGHAVRTQLALHHVAAACIQTAWRAWRARSQYHTVRAAVITVQAAYRGSRQRAVFMQQCMVSMGVVWMGVVWMGVVDD